MYHRSILFYTNKHDKIKNNCVILENISLLYNAQEFWKSYKQFYISFRIILNKRFLVFKTQDLYCHELIFCKWVKFAKTEILR